jgi:hypothetical protein
MVVAANKGAWDLGPEWCARYMLVKYMLYMAQGSCAHATIEPPAVDVQAGSRAGTPPLDTLRRRYQAFTSLDS